MPGDQRVSVRDAAIRDRNRRMMNRNRSNVGRSSIESDSFWSRFGGVKGLVVTVFAVAMIGGIAAAASSGGANSSNGVKVSKNSGEGFNSTNSTEVDLDPTQSPTKSPQPASTGWAPAPSTSSPSTATQPTITPSSAPTVRPTADPTVGPTGATGTPTASPTTGTPTESPSTSPTASPTTPAPTGVTGMPSISPTTTAPTDAPSMSPTDSPSVSPTGAPTGSPTRSPTDAPTGSPTRSPSGTSQPSESPSVSPSVSPTASPSGSPTCADLVRLSNIDADPATGVPPSGFVSLPIATGYGIAGVRKLMRFNTGFEDVRVTRVWLWLVGTAEEQEIVVSIITADELNMTNGTSFENVEVRVNLGNETPPFTTEATVTNFNYEFIPVETSTGEVLDELKANTTYYLSVGGTENAGAEWNVKCLNNVDNPCVPDTATPEGEFVFEGSFRNTLTNSELFTPDPILNGFAIEASCAQ